MAQQTEGVHYSLPITRIFPDNPNAKIMDCFLSNYNIEQSPEHIVRFTGLDMEMVERGVGMLVKEKMIKPSGDKYITDFGSDRLIGLYAYYRATLGANLTTAFSHRAPR